MKNSTIWVIIPIIVFLLRIGFRNSFHPNTSVPSITEQYVDYGEPSTQKRFEQPSITAPSPVEPVYQNNLHRTIDDSYVSDDYIYIPDSDFIYIP